MAILMVGQNPKLFQYFHQNFLFAHPCPIKIKDLLVLGIEKEIVYDF